jgi:hypothetical protein
MNKKFRNTHEEITFYNKVEELTDRELQELNAFNLVQLKNANNSIKKNVQFFFYVFLVGIAAAIVVTIK